MGMRVSHNARAGFADRCPQSAVLQDLVNPKSSLQVELFFLCDRLGVSRDKFDGWGDDELRGLTLELCQGLDIPKPQACQLVAKVNGMALVKAQEGESARGTAGVGPVEA